MKSKYFFTKLVDDKIIGNNKPNKYLRKENLYLNS